MTKTERIAFIEGQIEGITMYAIYRDGKQLVGCLQKPLSVVLAPYLEAIERLKSEMGA